MISSKVVAATVTGKATTGGHHQQRKLTTTKVFIQSEQHPSTQSHNDTPFFTSALPMEVSVVEKKSDKPSTIPNVNKNKPAPA